MSTQVPSPVVAPPLRVLGLVSHPSDLPQFDSERAWQEIAEALQPMVAQGTVLLERVPEPTESGLKRGLAQTGCHVLHMIVHGQDNEAANYGTIALHSSDGKARNLTASYLASLLAGSASLRAVILLAAGPAGSRFVIASNAMAEKGLAVITAPPLSGHAARIFVSKLYSGLLANLNASALMEELVAALFDEQIAPGALRFAVNDPARPILTLGSSSSSAAAGAEIKAAGAEIAAAGAEMKPTPPQPAASILRNPPTEKLAPQRPKGEFDVFLCHNWADKPAVKRIALQLKQAGVFPWLDVWELPPGQPWQPLLERQIDTIKSAAVFIGAAGIGPWQEQELEAFLRRFAKRKIPVIPVLLMDAPTKPELPLFLEGMTWVDFRIADPDPLAMLIWGITGEKPE